MPPNAVRLFLCLLLIAVLTPGPSAAEVSADSQALLLLRILAFDRKVSARAGDEVRIAVVYRSGSSESQSAQEQIVRALEAAAKKTSVAGLPVKVIRLGFAPTFDEDLARLRPAAVYLCPGLDDLVAQAVKVTRSHQALSFAGKEGYVSLGASVGLIKRESKATILVNLKASRAEGADLDSGLLQMAEVIR